MAPSPEVMADQYVSEYRKISCALDRVRNTFERAPPTEQRSMLFDASVYAITSVQNDVSILRTAFRGYARADDMDDVKDVMKHVNYGNNKFSYIKSNRDVVFGDEGSEICALLERGDVWDAVECIVDSIKGVSWIKAAFVPAMLGYKEVLCIDTNVAQQVDGVQARGYKTGDDYKEAVNMVLDQYPDVSDDWSPFMTQWILFDANRNDGITYHEEWFEHMLPGTPFGRQLSLNRF